MIDLLPPSASAFADRVDRLFIAMTALTGTVALVITILLIVFSIRYRKASTVPRPHAPNAARRRISHRIELAWTITPFLLFMVAFVWAAVLYHDHDIAPADALPVFIVAKQWMWKLEHPGGQREIDELHVPRGVPVRLTMISQDVIHSFFLPALRIKQDVLPGRYTSLWFTADRTGEFWLTCAEYCGTDHARMGGRIVVMEPADYERWLVSQGAARTMAAEGRRLFERFGCSGCHGRNATVRAPDLAGVYGRSVPLEGGGFAIADDRYLRDSILLPRKDIVAGYEPVMPSFAGRISEEELLDVVAYLKSLGTAEVPGR
jgi:cytochrome c oxidase subunit 2